MTGMTTGGGTTASDRTIVDLTSGLKDHEDRGEGAIRGHETRLRRLPVPPRV